MLITKRRYSLLTCLVSLTLLSVFAQILLLRVHSLTSNLIDSVVATSLSSQILHLKVFIFGAVGLVLSQTLMYTVLVAIIWYFAISFGELFALRWLYTYLFGLFLWLTGAAAVLAANCYFVPHSFFSGLIQDHFPLDTHTLQLIYKFGVKVFLVTAVLAFINLLRCLHRRENSSRHVKVIMFVALLMLISLVGKFSQRPEIVADAAGKPDVIIIGIDALRPDFVGFYQQDKKLTPNINAFLDSAVSFSDAYTPLPRTFPSWSSILTSMHPLHSGARGNITELSEIKVNDTLPKRFQQAGYETIYGTDDTRFNNTNEIFGFDRTITPPMGVNDFTLATANDFPLSNLLIPTFIGKVLFPFNYANHGTAITYTPNNFLSMLRSALHQRERKPLFLAVHFTVSHWPFYWFNDRQPKGLGESNRYSFGIAAADAQLASFLQVLNENKLLDHAIVILLSDHGTSLGIPGDRPTTALRYQGNKANINKLAVTKYSTLAGSEVKKAYGIDTSFGYGGDVLSMKQYHALLAFKGYGVNIGMPHQVAGKISMMDIAPTVLDLLGKPPIQNSDGISLKPYFLNPHLSPDKKRPLFLETTFNIDEISREGISIEAVLKKTVRLVAIDPKTGLVYLKRDAELAMNKEKQQGILQGDWLLARYPNSQRTRFKKDAAGQITLEKYIEPSYMVLVNLKTGKWTTELNGHFARSAPVQSLNKKLHDFYGAEMT